MNCMGTNYWPLVLVGFLAAQQVDSVDLTRPRLPSKIADRRQNLKSCGKSAGGGIGDGWTETPDHKPRRIVVKVVSASEMIRL
jgi:hypothetical protein